MAKVNLTGILERLLGISQIETEEQLDQLIKMLRETEEDLLNPQELAELMEGMKQEPEGETDQEETEEAE